MLELASRVIMTTTQLPEAKFLEDASKCESNSD